jgi:hypothetical protein
MFILPVTAACLSPGVLFTSDNMLDGKRISLYFPFSA